jgi:hypothetical protein
VSFSQSPSVITVIIFNITYGPRTDFRICHRFSYVVVGSIVSTDYTISATRTTGRIRTLVLMYASVYLKSRSGIKKADFVCMV